MCYTTAPSQSVCISRIYPDNSNALVHYEYIITSQIPKLRNDLPSIIYDFHVQMVNFWFPPYNLDLTRSWCFQKMCEHCRDVGMRQVLYSPPIVLLLTPSKITWLFGNLDRRPRVCGPRGPRRNTIVSFIIKLGMVLFGLSLCLELESGKQESKGRKERRSKSAPWRLCHIVLRATAVLQMLLIFIDLRESSSRTASSHSLCVKPLFTTPGETGDMCHNFCLMDGEAEVQSKAVTMSTRCMIPKSKDGMGFNHLCSPISRNIVDALKVLFVE